MVEINNSTCGVFDMLRWSRELITDVRNQKSWLWRHCRRRAIYWLPDHPRKLVTLNPKPQINGAGRTPASSCWWMSPSSWSERLLSEKVRDAVALQQIKERGALPMIDRGDIRQAIDRCSNISLHCRALVMVSSSIRLTAWLQNSAKGGTVRERLMYEQSHRDYLSALVICISSSACHGLLIITVITPLPTKPSATKMPENWSWRTRQLPTCRCVSVMLLRSMQNTRVEQLMLKLKWCSAWWCCRWSSSVAHQQSVSQCVKPPRLRRG